MNEAEIGDNSITAAKGHDLLQHLEGKSLGRRSLWTFESRISADQSHFANPAQQKAARL